MVLFAQSAILPMVVGQAAIARAHALQGGPSAPPARVLNDAQIGSGRGRMEVRQQEQVTGSRVGQVRGVRMADVLGNACVAALGAGDRRNAEMSLDVTPSTLAKNIFTGLPFAAVKLTVTLTALALAVALPVSTPKLPLVEFHVPSATSEFFKVTDWAFAVFSAAQALALDAALPDISPLAAAIDAASAVAWAWVWTTQR